MRNVINSAEKQNEFSQDASLLFLRSRKTRSVGMGLYEFAHSNCASFKTRALINSD